MATSTGEKKGKYMMCSWECGKLDFSYIAVEMYNGVVTMKHSVDSSKVKHIIM